MQMNIFKQFFNKLANTFLTRADKQEVDKSTIWYYGYCWGMAFMIAVNLLMFSL